MSDLPDTSGAGMDLEARRNTDSMVLAIIRTELANRRTLLAYVKTALGLSIAGLGLLKFAEADSPLVGVGFTVLPISALILAYGCRDYFRTRQQIRQEKLDAGV